MNVRLFAEEHLGIDLNGVAQILNDRCRTMTFSVGKSPLVLGDAVIHHNAYERLPKRLLKEVSGDDFTFIFTDKPYYNNYFFEGGPAMFIVSFFKWEYLTGLPMVNGVMFFVADILALHISDEYRHEDTTGCIFDFRWDKRGVDLCMRAAMICPTCQLRLKTRGLSEREVALVNDLRSILDMVSGASRWNENVLEPYRVYDKKRVGASAEGPELTLMPPNFLPEEDVAGVIDVSRERLNLLCTSYLKIMQPKLSAPEKGKAFEDFASTLFGSIRGWREIERNARLEDCEIDLIYDIGDGPRVLRDRMGLHVYVEVKHRSRKCDVAVIDHLHANMRLRGLSHGILLSFSGISGYDPLNWRRLQHAYRRIIDVSRQERLYVLAMAREDVEAVRNGRNLVTLLTDAVGRFVRV